MKIARSRSVSYLTAVVLLCAGVLLHGETHYVNVDDSGFSPSSLTITAGDTVVWENVDDFDFPHTTTCTLDLLDPDYWNILLVGLGDTYSKMFNNAGTFNYNDTYDIGTGTITVTPPVTAPVITLEAPPLGKR